MFTPWDAPGPAPIVSTAVMPGGAGGGLADGLISFYQRDMRSPHLPGQGCRMRPTCSVYARIAIERWYVLGLVLIADRLFVREHPFMQASYLPQCAIDGSDDEGMHDPVP